MKIYKLHDPVTGFITFSHDREQLKDFEDSQTTIEEGTFVSLDKEVLECCVEGCSESAPFLAHNRKTKIIGYFCEEHADEAVPEDECEYVENCPACNCRFGVN